MKCHDYNFTYVHRGFSFESTLQDALMQFEEGNQEEIPSGSRQRNYSNERDKNDDDELFRDVDDL